MSTWLAAHCANVTMRPGFGRTRQVTPARLSHPLPSASCYRQNSTHRSELFFVRKWPTIAFSGVLPITPRAVLFSRSAKDRNQSESGFPCRSIPYAQRAVATPARKPAPAHARACAQTRSAGRPAGVGTWFIARPCAAVDRRQTTGIPGSERCAVRHASGALPAVRSDSRDRPVRHT